MAIIPRMSLKDGTWSPGDNCERWVPSTHRAILECLIWPALVIAYLPQYSKIVKHGTAGISPLTILILCLFSTLQLASRWFNLYDCVGLNCIQEGHLRGWRAFSVLISNIDVLVQWACAMVLLYFFTKYRRTYDAANPMTLPLRTNVNGNPGNYDTASSIHELSTTKPLTDISSHLLLTIVSTHAITILSIGILFISQPRSNDMFYALVIYWTTQALHAIYVVLALIAVFFLCVSMIYDARASRHGGADGQAGFSLLSLALQALAFTVLGLAQYLRPDPEVGWELGKTSKLLEWYFSQGKVSVNYFIAAVGHVIALVLRLHFRRRHQVHETGRVVL